MIVKVMMLGIQIQSLYYIAMMYGIMKRKMNQYRQMHKKRIYYDWFGIKNELKELSFY